MKAYLRLETSLFFLIFFGVLWISRPGVAAPPNPAAPSPEQDAQSAILPFLDALASPPSGSARAFQITGRVEALAGHSFGTDFPPFDLSVEAPGRMRVQFPHGQNSVTACRNGQKLWASPAATVRELLARQPQGSQNLTLPPIQLPFSGTQLALFPALLQVDAKGEAPFGGVPCRVIDVRLLPQLARLLPSDLDGWAMRLWINPQNRPARVGIQRPGASAVLQIESIRFAANLPAETWQPPADAMEVPPSKLAFLFESLGQRKAVRPPSTP
ncbi:MAG: hypothetical protein RLZZ399_2298 [Verrucomicrobiota bacterium]|jgi:hypothetical protein